jgi:antitoxin VapB
MTKVSRTRVFKSGNSKAVRLPASYPVEPGDEVVVREERGRFVIEPVARKIDLTGLAGVAQWLVPLGNADRENERDLSWEILTRSDGD